MYVVTSFSNKMNRHFKSKQIQIELTRSHNSWIREILKSHFKQFYSKDFLAKYNVNQSLGSSKIDERFFEVIIDKTSAGDEYLKIISDKILPCTYIEGKKVEDIKNLLIDLLGKYMHKVYENIYDMIF